jgi:hypothetical protein
LLDKKVESIVSKLEDEADKKLVQNMFEVAQQTKAYIEAGTGSYALLKAVQRVYEPTIINLYLWTK